MVTSTGLVKQGKVRGGRGEKSGAGEGSRGRGQKKYKTKNICFLSPGGCTWCSRFSPPSRQCMSSSPPDILAQWPVASGGGRAPGLCCPPGLYQVQGGGYSVYIVSDHLKVVFMNRPTFSQKQMPKKISQNYGKSIKTLSAKAYTNTLKRLQRVEDLHYCTISTVSILSTMFTVSILSTKSQVSTFLYCLQSLLCLITSAVSMIFMVSTVSI